MTAGKPWEPSEGSDRQRGTPGTSPMAAEKPWEASVGSDRQQWGTLKRLLAVGKPWLVSHGGREHPGGLQRQRWGSPGKPLKAAIGGGGKPLGGFKPVRCCFFSFKKVVLAGFWRVGLGWGLCFCVAFWFVCFWQSQRGTCSVLLFYFYFYWGFFPAGMH